MQRKTSCLVILIIFISTLSFMGCGSESGSEQDGGIEEQTITAPGEKTQGEETFVQEDFRETRALHFVSSQPANNALLSAPPQQVMLTFTKELTPPSEIEVTCEGSDVTTASTTSISEDGLRLSVPIDAARTGNYQVEYSVTWTDGRSDTGSFGFSVQLP